MHTRTSLLLFLMALAASGSTNFTNPRFRVVDGQLYDPENSKLWRWKEVYIGSLYRSNGVSGVWATNAIWRSKVIEPAYTIPGYSTRDSRLGLGGGIRPTYIPEKTKEWREPGTTAVILKNYPLNPVPIAGELVELWAKPTAPIEHNGVGYEMLDCGTANTNKPALRK